MDKLLSALGDIVKSLFAISPAAAVLFIVCCALCWSIRHLYGKLDAAQKAAITQVEQATVKAREAELLLRADYQRKIDAKDCEITLLHERNVERDSSYAKVMEGLRIAIANGNNRPLIQSVWNGVSALGKHHDLDLQDMRMLEHMHAPHTGESPLS